MAKTSTPIEAPAIVLIDFVEPVAANAYAGHIQAMIESGQGTQITVPTADVVKHSKAFQKAANDADKTARKRLAVEDGDNTVITFTLTEKYAPKTRGSAVADAEAEDVAAE